MDSTLITLATPVLHSASLNWNPEGPREPTRVTLLGQTTDPFGLSRWSTNPLSQLVYHF